jgi:transposase, IS30 family
MPRIPAPSSGHRLTLAEREEIAVRVHAGDGVRAIARALGRPPSTISRELARHRVGYPRGVYRASIAQAAAAARARRPKPAKLSQNLRLRREVAHRLREGHSPEQIAGRLVLDFPDEPEMRVSHETIYQSLYVQARGALRRDLALRLRTGRTLRKPRRSSTERRGRIPGMVNIAERPPEAQDRAVAGHWEGDLILGTGNQTAIGTLVERASGFLILLHLPHGHGAVEVHEAMCTAMADLPATLRRTLTWDQGKEMANHARIAAATDLDIYFCDPHSPWQRGTNENTNGLLRQYFPKSTDLSFHGPGILENVASELNRRPRKRHGWRTPAEVLDQLLSQHDIHGVAPTA